MPAKPYSLEMMRQDLHLSQREFAGVLHVNRVTLAQVENMQRRPTQKLLDTYLPYVLLLQEQLEPAEDAVALEKASLQAEVALFRQREKLKLTARLLTAREEQHDLIAKYERGWIVLNRLLHRLNDAAYTAISPSLLEVLISRQRESIQLTSPVERAKLAVRIALLEGALVHLTEVEGAQNQG